MCWASPMIETRSRKNSNPGVGCPPGTRPGQLFLLLLRFCLLRQFCCTAHASLKLAMLLLSLTYWGYRYAPPCQARLLNSLWQSAAKTVPNMGWRKMRKKKTNLTETAHQTEDGCGGLGCRKLGLVRRDRVTTDMLRAGLKADIEGSSCYGSALQ